MDTLTRALRGFRERYPGQEGSWKRLEGWLLDHAPNEKRVVKALVAVPKLDLHVDMARLQGRADVFSFRRLVDAMTAQEGLAGDLAEHAILVWFDAMGVQAPDASALRGPLDKGLVVASVECGRCLHLALVQAGLPLVTGVRVESVTARTLSDLTVSVWLSGAEAGSPLKSTTWTAPLEPLRGKHVAILVDVDARVAPTALREIRAAASGRWWVEVKSKDEVLLRTFHDVEVAPARVWPLGRVATPALAAFVLRDDSTVAEIVGEAASRVDDADPRPAATKAFEAVQAVLRDMSIAIAGDDGNVKGPRAIVTGASGSAIDHQLLVAACLEHGGMPPLLLWTSTGPALGLWSTADRPALTETDDPELVARLADAGALNVVAIGDHVVRLRESAEHFLALDLTAARRAGVVPLDGVALDDKNVPGPPPEGLRQRLLDRAALAANRTGLLLPGAWAAKLGRRADVADDTPPRVQQWKRRLLDLTLNNPLLNLKQRATSLPLLIANVAALEDSLASGQTFRLDPRPPATQQQVTTAMMEGAIASGAILVDLTDKRVVTAAKNALRAFRSALDEGGVHTLFVTLGTLEWTEAAKPNEPRRAPLLIVPVMIRRSKRGHYEIKKAESDTELNAALLEFLRREHGVEVPGVDPLPVDHAGVDVTAVLAAVRKAITGVPAMASWKVHEDAQLAILAFSGYRMWRDLDHQAADLLRHPLVRRLAVGGADKEAIAFPEASKLDERPARDVLCPLEADGSQVTAVIAGSEGKSFVLEGPPGTGKSQTIANLIAQCLASEKTVLFVSQKRAALEVVQTRLEAIGLGPFLLELHSKKASKPEFIQQLRIAAEFRARKPAKDWNVEADALGNARSELNAVVRALHDKRDPGQSVYGAIGEAEMRRDGPRLAAAQVEFDPARANEPGWIDEAKIALGDLVATFERLTDGWRELDLVRATDWPKARRDQLETELAELDEAARALASTCAGLDAWFPALGTASADDIDLADVVLAQIETSPQPKLALLQKNDDVIDKWLERIDEARQAERALADRWLPALVDQSLEPRIARIRQWMGVFLLGWLMLIGVRWFFRALTKTSVPPNAKLLEDAEAAVALAKKRAAIAKTTDDLVERVGDVELDDWKLPEVDAESIRKLVAFAKGVRNRTARFPAALALAAEGADASAHAAPIAAFRSARKRFETARQAATATLDLAAGFAKPAERGYLDAVIARAAALRANIPKLREWGAYRKNRDAALALGLGRVIRALEKGEAPKDDLVAAFSNAWLGWWIDHHVAGEKMLASFDGLKQRLREERFASVDRQLRDLARHEILARIASRQPRLDEGAPPTSQAGILLRQFGKRAGFASPRQLFSECAGLIRQLKPCVLMSPQSVAQYLDPSQPPFDVVVFDEASQVPTHEAIGAIARGRGVVVVGDSKQLPPTSFFLGKAAETDDEGNDDVVAELDSILEECSASGVPSLGLAWHYRSRHPSLISFSNSRYYGGRLQVLPAARARTSAFGVAVKRVANAVYDRGNTATNVVEAKELVAELVRRLRDPAENRRSMAVVTFSRAQQDLVEDLLEEAREQHPEIEAFFDPERPEPLIVKNLENIQGDERDVVLFSIGYGPDAKGRMTANMGPLGQLGGERRLNVAITRAREQLVVYVSFDAASLDLSTVSARGLHDLKAFLENASAWENVTVGAQRADVDAGEEALKRALASRIEAAGHHVDLDVGVGRYRVDIAVRDPSDDGKYTLGIELDGSLYAGTDTARDRDRLRWEVLGGLGWRMARARALDWYEDRDGAVAAMLDEIEKARTATPPPPEIAAEPIEEDEEGEDVVPHSSFRLPYTACKPAARSGEFKWGHVEVPALIVEIVAAEGPISERMLARRIGETWGTKRTPTGLAAQASNVLARIAVDARPVFRDGFFWPRALDVTTWRTYRVPVANEPDTRRELDDIPVEEIANAAEDMRSRYGEMTREDLARAVAKRFGFRGLTQKIAQRVELGVTLAEQRRAASAP